MYAFAPGADLYQIVGCKSDASTTEIKRAYRKAALQYHPDKGGDPLLFQGLHAAVDILLDPAPACNL